ncbi:unnamed protein product [Brassica napus]|uniref:(rape) hypothetical protein n=1 Tax=Brassica napus TaxID=3708 RepID=A0A816IV93_BRANA|nr:unnamed protein product [Brassica napus]
MMKQQKSLSTNDTARFIVYELMPNVSLKSYLHGSGSSRGSAITITWPMSMKIALDISRGLEYLHEGCHPDHSQRLEIFQHIFGL